MIFGADFRGQREGENSLGNKSKYYLFGLVALLLIIQLIPVNRDNPLSDEKLEIDAPLEIIKILKNSCYDCHSNQTNWPFYSYIAPVSWLVAQDVKNGRKEFNLSEWSILPARKREEIKKEMIEEVKENKMPLPIYLIMHPEAKLSDQQRQILEDWADSRALRDSTLD